MAEVTDVRCILKGSLTRQGADVLTCVSVCVPMRVAIAALVARPPSGRVPRQLTTVRRMLVRHLAALPPQGVAMTIGKIAPAAGISWLVYEETRIILKCADHPCLSEPAACSGGVCPSR